MPLQAVSLSRWGHGWLHRQANSFALSPALPRVCTGLHALLSSPCNLETGACRVYFAPGPPNYTVSLGWGP